MHSSPRLSTPLPGTYDTTQLPRLVDYMRASPVWSPFFESSRLAITEETVAKLMHYLVDFRRPLIVEGCRTQCSFCSHTPPTDPKSAPWANFTTLIDELNILKHIADIQFSYTIADTSLHRNGETTQYASRVDNKLFTAHDALLYIAGEKNPLYRRGTGRNILNLFSAGWHGATPSQAMTNIVRDADCIFGTDPDSGYKGALRLSIHMFTRIYRQNPERWKKLLAENFQTVRPLLDKDRLKISIHYYREGYAPSQDWAPYYLGDQLAFFSDVLRLAGYTHAEQKKLLDTQNDNSPYSVLRLQKARLSSTLQQTIPPEIYQELEQEQRSYDEHIAEVFSRPPEYFSVRGHPQLQLMILARTGEMMYTPPHEERKGAGPDAQLVELPGRIHLPVEQDPVSHYSNLARKNILTWLETPQTENPTLSREDLLPYIPRDDWFPNSVPVRNHGKDHLLRTLILAHRLADKVEHDLAITVDRKSLSWAAALHDIRTEPRSSGKPWRQHSQDCAEWVLTHLSEIDANAQVETVARLCAQHDNSDADLPARKSWELRILQDADALERARFSSSEANYQANPLYFNTVYAHQLTREATELAQQTAGMSVEQVIAVAEAKGLLAKKECPDILLQPNLFPRGL